MFFELFCWALAQTSVCLLSKKRKQTFLCFFLFLFSVIFSFQFFFWRWNRKKKKLFEQQNFGKEREEMGGTFSSKKSPRERRTGKWEQVKVVVVGDGAVGKTSMLITFTTKQFPTEYLPTIFRESFTQHLIDDQKIGLSIWDTAGHAYARLRPLSYPHTDVLLVCFSVASPSSFEGIKTRWISEISQFCPGVPFIVVAMKTDLRKSEETVKKLGEEGKEIITPEQGHQMAHEVGAIQYMECSSLTHQESLKELFDEAMRIGLGDEPSVQSWIGKGIKGAKGR